MARLRQSHSPRQAMRRKIHVGIGEQNPRSGGARHAQAHGMRFTQPARRQLAVANHLQRVRTILQRLRLHLLHPLSGPVRRAVVDRDNLQPDVLLREQRTQRRRNRFFFITCGNNDCKLRTAARGNPRRDRRFEFVQIRNSPHSDKSLCRFEEPDPRQTPHHHHSNVRKNMEGCHAKSFADADSLTR